MGRCSSCRNKTLYFCYVNREFVCLNCVFQPRYELSVVRSYKDWIRDSSYEDPPRCPLTGALLRHGQELLRLPPPDLRVVSTEGLAAYLRSRFGPDTTPLGFQTSELPYGVVPDPQDDSAVAQRLRRFLAALGYDAALAVARATDQGSASGNTPWLGSTNATTVEAALPERKTATETRATARSIETTGGPMTRAGARTGANLAAAFESHGASETESVTNAISVRKQVFAARPVDDDNKERKMRQQRIRRFLNFLGQGAEVLPLPHPRPHRRARRLIGLLLCLGLGVGMLLLTVYTTRYGVVNPWMIWRHAPEASQGVHDSKRHAR